MPKIIKAVGHNERLIGSFWRKYGQSGQLGAVSASVGTPCTAGPCQAAGPTRWTSTRNYRWNFDDGNRGNANLKNRPQNKSVN